MMNSLKRITTVLLLLLALAPAYAQEISVSYKGTKLSTVIADIQSKSDYKFVYNNSLVDVNLPVTASAKGDI